MWDTELRKWHGLFNLDHPDGVNQGQVSAKNFWIFSVLEGRKMLLDQIDKLLQVLYVSQRQPTSTM